MTSQVETHKAIVPLNMKVDAKKRNLIDNAANLLGQQRTQFVLEAALARAESVLLDRRLFVLSDEQFDAFDQVLNQPRPDEVNECLQQLLNRPDRWG